MSIKTTYSSLHGYFATNFGSTIAIFKVNWKLI